MSTLTPLSSTSSQPVFISHASADRMMVNFFVDQVLVAGIGLSPSLIFNTSAASSPISAGDNFSPRIRQAIGDCKLVIALVSRNFYRSPFCMSELGAAWAANKLLPVLVPPISFENLEGVLHGTHCIRLDDGEKIFELYERFNEADWVRCGRAGVFAAKAKEFIASLPEKLARLPEPEVIERAEYHKLKVQVEDLSAKLQESAAVIEKFRVETPALVNEKKAIPSKDKIEPQKTIAARTGKLPAEESAPKHGDVHARLRSLIEAANQIAESVPGVVRRMVYSAVVREVYRFTVFESEKAEWITAQKEGLIKRGDEGDWFLNFSSARVERLHGAYEAVGSFLGTVDSGFRFDYEVARRHVPSLHDSSFASAQFGFWWEDDPDDLIPF